jgi:predicted Fe-Mo cluster-binding NifX family protein
MSFKVALSSSNGKETDLHFGNTEIFYILSVDEQSGAWELSEQRPVPQGTGCRGSVPEGNSDGCLGHNDERLNAVIRLLNDCSYVLTARIGRKPHMFLKRAGITALEAPVDIAEAISKLTVYHRRYSRVNQERHSGGKI